MTIDIYINREWMHSRSVFAQCRNLGALGPRAHIHCRNGYELVTWNGRRTSRCKQSNKKERQFADLQVIVVSCSETQEQYFNRTSKRRINCNLEVEHGTRTTAGGIFVVKVLVPCACTRWCV